MTRLDGAKERKSVYGRTLTEAQNKAQRLMFETNRQLQDTISLSELSDLWRKEWTTLAPSTRRSYEYGLALLLPALGRLKCDSLSVPNLMSVVMRQDTDRKARQIKTTLSMLLNFGVLVGAITANPIKGLKAGRAYKPERKKMRAQDLADATAEMDPSIADFFLFLGDVGLRPWKEAINLTRDDIGYANDEYYVKVASSKTKAGQGRVVPFSDADLAYRLMQREGRLFKSHSTYKRAWKSDFPIYSLRSLAISRWCESEEDLDVIKMRAGHTDIRLTLDIYNEVRKERILTGKGVEKGYKVSDLVGANR